MTIDRKRVNPRALFIWSKRGKRMIRLREGSTQDFGIENPVGFYMNTKEAHAMKVSLHELNVTNNTLGELLEFGARLEKLFPKNEVSFARYNDNISEKELNYIGKYGSEKFDKIQTMKGLGL